MLHLEAWEPRNRHTPPSTPHLIRLTTGGVLHAVRPRDPRKTLCGLRVPNLATRRDQGEPTCTHCRAALNRCRLPDPAR